jgi:flagellar biosynthesis/type III secretory pathway M-ring protein FliF/YscJ
MKMKEENTKHVSAAIGYNQTRGDIISVEGMKL